jgi:hypothetical protein
MAYEAMFVTWPLSGASPQGGQGPGPPDATINSEEMLLLLVLVIKY